MSGVIVLMRPSASAVGTRLGMLRYLDGKTCAGWKMRTQGGKTNLKIVNEHAQLFGTTEHSPSFLIHIEINGLFSIFRSLEEN